MIDMKKLRLHAEKNLGYDHLLPYMLEVVEELSETESPDDICGVLAIMGVLVGEIGDTRQRGIGTANYIKKKMERVIEQNYMCPFKVIEDGKGMGEPLGATIRTDLLKD